MDSSGNVFVADTYNHIIRRIDLAGNVSTIAGQTGVTGSADGLATNATFNKPIGVAIDSSGNIYVADNGNHQIRKIDSSGNVTTIGGQVGIAGSTNGQGTDAKFNKPVYKDSILVAEENFIGDLVYQDYNFVVGYNSILNRDYFKGSMDQLIIYNRAFSQEQINLIYNN